MFDPNEELGAKVELIIEIVGQSLAASPPRKVVVFTWHRLFSQILQTILSKEFNTKARLILGGMNAADQYAEAKALHINNDTRILVGTIASMGTGLNLQAASTVVFAEISYVPSDNAQALSRVVRPGQEQTVLQYFPIAKGTIEEYVHKQVMEKQVNVNAFFSSYRKMKELVENM
jgi:SNF2 family DNA or RNA helicase